MRAAIELFGSPYCTPCARAKDVIAASVPTLKGVKFTYVDVTEDPAYGMKQLPVIFVGDEVLEGPSESELRAALDRLYAAVAPPPPPPSPPPAPQPASPGPETQPAPEAKPPSPQQIPWIVVGVFAVLGFMGVRTLGLD